MSHFTILVPKTDSITDLLDIVAECLLFNQLLDFRVLGFAALLTALPTRLDTQPSVGSGLEVRIDEAVQCIRLLIMHMDLVIVSFALLTRFWSDNRLSLLSLSYLPAFEHLVPLGYPPDDPGVFIVLSGRFFVIASRYLMFLHGFRVLALHARRRLRNVESSHLLLLRAFHDSRLLDLCHFVLLQNAEPGFLLLLFDAL